LDLQIDLNINFDVSVIGIFCSLSFLTIFFELLNFKIMQTMKLLNLLVLLTVTVVVKIVLV